MCPWQRVHFRMRWNHCVLKLQAKGDTVYSCNLATSNKKRVSRNNVALIYLKMLWKYGVYRLLNSIISSETVRHFQKHPRKLRRFCVFRSVLLDSDGFCRQKSWFPVSVKTRYGVRICCICASCPPHPRAMDDGLICGSPHSFYDRVLIFRIHQLLFIILKSIICIWRNKPDRL